MANAGENMPPASEAQKTKVEQFVKADNYEVKNVTEAMSEADADKFAGEIVKAYKRPGSMESKAVIAAIEQVAQESNLSVDVIRALAERRVDMKNENGTLSEASYYGKPLEARAREMVMILEEAKKACTPAEFEDYCKMMAPIIMKYQKNMPAEYVSKVSANMDPKDLAVIDAQFDKEVSPKQLLERVMEGALGRNREKSAEHIAKWFSVSWPEFTKKGDINEALTDYARFITNTYALEWDNFNKVKDLVHKDFKKPFQNAIEKAKNEYPNDSSKAKDGIKMSLKKDFGNYYDKHFAS